MTLTKHLFPSLLFLITLCFTSCDSNSSIFDTTEERMIGQWRYEEVRFRDGFSSSDVTRDYKMLVLDFYNDFTVEESNLGTGLKRQGVWAIDATEFYNQADDTSEYFESIIFSLSDTATQAMELFIWKDVSVTSREIRYTEQKDGGTYLVTLRKN